MSKKKLKFDVGAKIIIHHCSEYNGQFTSELGEIVQIFNKSKNEVRYGVKLNNFTNQASSKGLYWFKPSSLVFFQKESEETLMFENFVVAKVEFLDNPNSGVHSYALYEDAKVNVEDDVVVCTGHHGFALAKVVAISLDPKDKKQVQCGREVVCRVDFSKFFARKDAIKKAIELKAEMKAHIEQSRELALYESLAQNDPVLRKMLDEYKSLMGIGSQDEH